MLCQSSAFANGSADYVSVKVFHGKSRHSDALLQSNYNITMAIFQMPLGLEIRNLRRVVANITNMSRTSQLLKHQVDENIKSKEVASKAIGSCGIERIESISRRPICGNGVCEIQETPGIGGRYECPEDCPFKFSQCGFQSESPQLAISEKGAPCAGNGACHPAGSSPRCSCYLGFDSNLCDQCAAGFIYLKGSCVKRQSPLLSILPTTMVTEGKMT